MNLFATLPPVHVRVKDLLPPEQLFEKLTN